MTAIWKNDAFAGLNLVNEDSHFTANPLGYNQLTADYAKENYARAYKRIQIIITFLHGEQPEDVNLTTAEETAAASAAE